MPNMTFSLPDDLHGEMRAHPEIKWAEIARRAIRQELERLHAYERAFARSEFTEADAVRVGREARRAAAKRRRGRA